MNNRATLQHVLDQHLCMGCGACAARHPSIVHMADTVEHGRRPVIAENAEPALVHELSQVCPGRSINAVSPPPTSIARGYDHVAWGPILEVWEGHATDQELRYRGASGGVVSALSLYCMEKAGYKGTIQVRSREGQPLLNETVISRSRKDILAASASRYSPASPCERLADIRGSVEPHVFIGKPCDIAGAALLQREDPSLANVIMLKISIFCAGTPSLAGTRELLSLLGLEDGDEVLDLSFRGRGWPGEMAVQYRCAKSGKIKRSSTSYARGWGDILQKHKQWRCQLCADHLGDHADLSVGDPWYRAIEANEPGRSLIIVRTEMGRQILRAAKNDGALHLEKRSIKILAASQPNLELTKGAVFGRCLSIRAMGISAPRYPGGKLFRVWWRALSPVSKFKSVAGTIRRLLKKQIHRRECVTLLGRYEP